MRRWVLLLAVLWLAAGPFVSPGSAAAATRCTSGEPCVVVSWVGEQSGSQVVSTVDLDQMQHLATQTYASRSSPGGPITDDNYPTPVTVEELLSNIAETPPSAVTFVTIRRADGTDSTLSGSDLNTPQFVDGAVPAIFQQSSGIGYIRPLRNLTGDTNRAPGASDILLPPTTDNELDITVHTQGTLLTPSVSVTSPSPLKARTPVGFAATFADGSPPADLRYSWTFLDGASPQGGPAELAHRYSTGGTYRVQVTVRSAATTSFGQSVPFYVRIGAPAKTHRKHGKPGTGAGKKTEPATGPKRGVGHGTDETPGPGTTGPQATPTGNGATGAGSTGTQTSSAPTPSRSSTSTRTAASARRSGPLVNGFLLTPAAQTLPVDTSVPSPTKPATAPAARKPVEKPVDLRPLWWLLAPVLLVLGVLSERRRPARLGAGTHQ